MLYLHREDNNAHSPYDLYRQALAQEPLRLGAIRTSNKDSFDVKQTNRTETNPFVLKQNLAEIKQLCNYFHASRQGKIVNFIQIINHSRFHGYSKATSTAKSALNFEIVKFSIQI